MDINIFNELKNRGAITNPFLKYTDVKDFEELLDKGFVNGIGVRELYADVLNKIGINEIIEEPTVEPVTTTEPITDIEPITDSIINPELAEEPTVEPTVEPITDNEPAVEPEQEIIVDEIETETPVTEEIDKTEENTEIKKQVKKSKKSE